MHVEIENHHQYVHEMRTKNDLTGVPLSREGVTQNVSQLIDELITNATLADCLAPDAEEVRVRVTPDYDAEPVAKSLVIQLRVAGSDDVLYSQRYSCGPWTRNAQSKVLQLREEGTIGENETAYQMLLALKRDGHSEITPPPVESSPIGSSTLESCGVRSLGTGSLVPDRPVLINGRLASNAVRWCEEADVIEAGGAAYGQIVRLNEPLPGTETRIVTILSGTLLDQRHVGEATQFHFNPAALADAQQMCDMRGFDERVLTVVHTHGWSNKCGNCNQNANCPLAEAKPSLQDYKLLATLFPSKSTLMPIAGRKLGAEGQRPSLQVYAWRLGEMRPIRWMQYDD